MICFSIDLKSSRLSCHKKKLQIRPSELRKKTVQEILVVSYGDVYDVVIKSLYNWVVCHPPIYPITTTVFLVAQVSFKISLQAAASQSNLAHVGEQHTWPFDMKRDLQHSTGPSLGIQTYGVSDRHFHYLREQKRGGCLYFSF